MFVVPKGWERGGGWKPARQRNLPSSTLPRCFSFLNAFVFLNVPVPRVNQLRTCANEGQNKTKIVV